MTSWSFSHFSLALQCLQKYKYVVIDKLVSGEPDSSDLLFGSALHSAINSALTNEDAAATFEIYWDSYREQDVSYGRYNWGQLKNLGLEFLRKFNKFHAPKYKLIFAEQRLYAEYKGIKLEGTPDFYGEYDGKRSLRDFKTAGRNYELEKTDCALQLYLYTYLLKEANFKLPDTLGYTVFNKGTGSIQDLTWGFEEAKMYEALDQMSGYINSVLNLENRSPSQFHKNYASCLNYNKRCEFFDRCYPKKEETNE